MQDSVSETREVSYAITDAFKNLGLVITAFGKAVCKTYVKRVEDQTSPVMDCSGTFVEFGKMSGFGMKDPVSKQFFCHI